MSRHVRHIHARPNEWITVHRNHHSHKGGKGGEELNSAEYAIKELGGEKGTICEYTFETNDATNERTLIEICKVKNTSSKYPRGGGKPFKAPLHMV